MSDLPIILVIDDEVRSLESITRILDEDFEVRTATKIAEATRILEED